MITPLYHIQLTEDPPELDGTCSLILQLDTNALFYVLMKDEKLLELKYFRLDTGDLDSFVLELESVLQDNTDELDKFILIYNLPDSNLVPEEFFEPGTNREIIELTHGDLHTGIIHADEVSNWDLRNVYRIPAEVYDLMGRRFPDAVVKHFNTLWLESFTKDESGFKMIVLPGQILVLLFREGRLLISQRFSYETDDDIYFYLLTLAKQFELDRQITAMEVSGFILKDSSLLLKLKEYFPLMKLSTTSHPTGQFPAHFFSPILNLAKCVL